VAKFLVTAEMYPGAYRAGVGFFGPGEVLELPDAASKPGDKVSARLQPLDDEAVAMLAKDHPELAKDKKLKALAAPEPKSKKLEEPKGDKGKGGRESDK
jgi:hypothetical protein